jgi:hypothetical protein
MGKNNWAWGRMVSDLPALDYVPLQDDSLESIDDDGDLRSDAARETVWPLLDTTQVDAKAGKFIWSDGKRLGIEHTVRRIDKEYPELGRDMIESKIISWLEMVYVPTDLTPEQMDEFEELIDRWLERHESRASRGRSA